MSVDVMMRPFEHIGFLYAGDAQYVAGCTAFLRRGLSAGDAVMVAVPSANGRLIRDAIGAERDNVRFADMTTVGRNPGRIIPWVLDEFAAAHADRRVSIIGEPIWPGRTAVEYPACAAHEALINVAFTGRDAAILCPYDTAHLGKQAIDDAWRTHPLIANECGQWPSSAGRDPIGTAAAFNLPLPAPPVDAARYSYSTAADLASLRTATVRAADAVRLEPDRVGDLTLAVTELAANTLEHTRSGCGVLSLWIEPGMLVCQFDDDGQLRDPMAGRIRPAASAPRGRGLVLVNRLVDMMRTYSRPAGTTTRIHMHTPTHQTA
jgi:anti-sigma regulatory factor (Ser/Thr protein kinase)